MKTGEDEERKLIAVVKGLLDQNGEGRADGGDADDTVPEGEQSAGQPVTTGKAGLRSLVNSILASPHAGEGVQKALERSSAAVGIGAGPEDPLDAAARDGEEETAPLSERLPIPPDDLPDGISEEGDPGVAADAVQEAVPDEEDVDHAVPARRIGNRSIVDATAVSGGGSGSGGAARAAETSAIGGLLSRAKSRPGSDAVQTEEDEAEAGVISVEELGNLADLILPKNATFRIDELHVNRHACDFDFADNARIVSKFDDILSRTLSTATLSRAAEVVTPPPEVEPQRVSRFRKLRLPKVRQVVEEYNPAVHGPLVDLAFRATQGVEEIELYPVHEPYAYIRVTYDSATHEYTYNVIEPELSPAEQELFGEIKERLFETLDITARDITRATARKALRDSVNMIIADYGIDLPPREREKILYHVEKEFLGDGLIDPIMHDKYIEDISCDGVNSIIFVYHTTYESMKTNLKYRDAAELDSFVTKLAQRAGKYISIAEPMLDATMGDGSRIQMTLGSEVTAHGSTFTIRKFRDEPITPTDLIEWHTFSPLGIAFLWLAVENGKSCIFAGGTASGKTTTLNAISLFIPPLAKIVTLEDTRELKLPHPNWIPSITRDSFSSDGRGEIDMYELLRAALRQRPEYILVGEVRGREALTLFQAMSTGHVTYATMHADSVASAVHRLENPPINVPRNMLSALNLISIQVQARVGGQRIRRNKQLIEVLDIDPRTNELITNEVFRWHPATDEIRYSGKSYILEQIMEDRGWSEERMREELKRRQEVLEWMRIKKIRYYKDVSKILISYYRDPEPVIQRVRADLYGEGGSP